MKSLMTEEANKEIYKNYRRLNGKINYGLFKENLSKFYEITMDIFLFDFVRTPFSPRDKGAAYKKWVEYITSKEEAFKYYTAVNEYDVYK